MKRWVIWTIVVVAWSVFLEIPVRTPTGMPGGEWIATYRFLIAKSLHIGMYAGITVLSAWVPLAARYRAGMMFFLMLHASVTELLQQLWKPYFDRGGALGDVGFDHLGIGIGFALSWKWWTRPDQSSKTLTIDN